MGWNVGLLTDLLGNERAQRAMPSLPSMAKRWDLIWTRLSSSGRHEGEYHGSRALLQGIGVSGSSSGPSHVSITESHTNSRLSIMDTCGPGGSESGYLDNATHVKHLNTIHDASSGSNQCIAYRICWQNHEKASFFSSVPRIRPGRVTSGPSHVLQSSITSKDPKYPHQNQDGRERKKEKG